MPNTPQKEAITGERGTEATVTVFQHNCGRRAVAHHTLLQDAFSSNATLIFIEEPYVFNVKGLFETLSHPSYYLLYPFNSPSATIRPRVVAYVRISARLSFSTRFDLVSDSDLQVIDFQIGVEAFTVYHIYNERQQHNENGLYTLQRLLYNLPISTSALLLGDFNLHHPLWNNNILTPSRLADTLATWLERSLFSLIVDLEVINSKGGTFLRSQEDSVIDLAFSKGFSNVYWTEWNYIDPTGSDHQSISFKGIFHSSSTIPSLATLLPLYNVKKADWKVFTEVLTENADSLAQNLDDALVFNDFESAAGILATAINFAAELAIPKLKISD